MDCGVPFCHHGCPLGNRIPDWNELVRSGAWEAAADALHATNNFPEFTGRLCPAPCEAACVLDIPGADGTAGAVTIKQIEVEIIDRAVGSGRVDAGAAAARAAGTRATPARRTGSRVAVVGSGPAGLAAAQQLARAGHRVTVYDRDEAPGGLLRFGIPDFKLEKHHIDRRVDQLAAEGVRFETGCWAGVDTTGATLRAEHDAVLLACGALSGRDTATTPGRRLRGVHLAMAHLVDANRAVAGRPDLRGRPSGESRISAAGRRVVIIGGGDTAADCLGVAHRQGARSVVQLDLYPMPPAQRDADRDPWPTWPWLLRSYPAHEEGGERDFAVAVQAFLDDGTGAVAAVRASAVIVSRSAAGRVVTPVPGTERDIPADLVLLAIGFDGTEDAPLLRQLGLARTGAGTVGCGPDWQTATPGVFVAGDMHRGASLIVWAIAEGRSAAASVHRHLGGGGQLPAPVQPGSRPMGAAG
jgi:glutamate synthase (NADPH) small chain